MTDIIPQLDRCRFYAITQGVNTESIQKYIEELESTRERMRKEWRPVSYFYNIDSRVVREMGEMIDKEIEYCKFYLKTQERKNTEQFNRWITIKREDVKFCSYDKDIADGEQIVKTNGKVKAIIEFDRTKKMVGITVRFENDSHILDFMTYHENAKIRKKSNLKNEDSIKKRVKKYKDYADRVIEENLYPYSPEKNRFDLLKKLLHN